MSAEFDAAPERVWQLLMDTTALSSCIPGCESLDPDPEKEHGYRIRLSVKLAAAPLGAKSVRKWNRLSTAPL